MYDAIDWASIPENAELVAGYVDGARSIWPSQAWDRFKNAKAKIQISTWGPRNLGNCLDIEPGDSIPEDARPWAINALARGIQHPILYCSLGDFPKVRSYCEDLPVQYWIAHYTAIPHIPLGADACQWASDVQIGTTYDVSLCQPWFPR